ncbi:TolC family outer membrane protein [Ancylobacter oerskovii]|uniref:TolC family outer membrane protein n=1 Tax=Ancylobacter oerskovii TaxID=459519 RepID=A0ABW4Z2T6_9HYPH|nr:TolC family outer membrane protein [Ancylobacter oerskovii]MBS7546290.1 TolC family outer membrane protein [Ancylobacter oerskovii]
MWLDATGGRLVASAITVFVIGTSLPAAAQTLDQALVSAYNSNPTLNSQRAATRATDEYVPIALGGYRPQVFGTASIGAEWTETRIGAATARLTGVPTVSNNTLFPSGFGVTISQTIYDGLRTANSVRGAESQVRGQRELLRNTEQLVLLDGVTAYMNVLQNSALVELQKQNLAALQEELRAARDRFAVGEITRTDVAQAEASVANAQSLLSQAQSNLTTSQAVFFQVTGLKANKLSPGRPIDPMLPKNVDTAIQMGLGRHPAVKAAEFAVDASMSNVKVAESALSPQLSLQGTAGSNYNSSTTIERATSATASLNLTVPIYQGGSEFATIRQTKELLSQSRIEVDVNRDQVRANVVQYWGALVAAKDAIESAQASVAANEIALRGVREEWRVGQRTTLDVLNAQTALFNARASLVIAQRDRVVASYAVLSSVGELNSTKLSLKVATYNPKIHYNQVRDAWIGVRTPGGQ